MDGFGSVSVEELAVSKVKDILLTTGKIDPRITDGDKSISWDGEIILYKDKSFSKNAFSDAIPVQVKGVSVKEFKSNISIGLADMINYKKKDRILYFVVQFKSATVFKIFCAPMANWDIHNFIKKCGKKKSMQYRFDELSVQPEEVLKYIIHFSVESQKQKTLIDNVWCLDDLKSLKIKGNISFSITTKGNSLKDFFDTLREEKPYVYLTNTDGIQYPIDRIEENLKLAVCKNIDPPIYLDDKKIHEHCTIKYLSEKEYELSIGNNINVYVKGDSIESKLTYRISGSLNDRIDVLILIIGALENRISYENTTIHFGDDPYKNDTLQCLKNKLEFYINVKKLFNEIGIKKELDFEQCNDEDYKKLYEFYKSELYDEVVNLTIPTDGISNAYLKIGNLNILCYCINYCNGKSKVFSIFKKNYLKFKMDFDGNCLPVSKYALLLRVEGNAFEKIDNIVYDDLVEDLPKYHSTIQCLEMTNQIMLMLLNYYDKTNELESLNTCLRIANKLKEDAPKNILYKLNEFQIRKRLNEIEEDDVLQLVNIRDNADDEQIKWACSILLDSKSEAQLYFKRLPIEQQQDIKSYLIYNLYKQLIQ